MDCLFIVIYRRNQNVKWKASYSHYDAISVFCFLIPNGCIWLNSHTGKHFLTFSLDFGNLLRTIRHKYRSHHPIPMAAIKLLDLGLSNHQASVQTIKHWREPLDLESSKNLDSYECTDYILELMKIIPSHYFRMCSYYSSAFV